MLPLSIALFGCIHIGMMKIASLSNYPIMRAEARGLLGVGD